MGMPENIHIYMYMYMCIHPNIDSWCISDLLLGIKDLEYDYNNFTYSSHGISHFDDKGVSSIGTGADGVSPASMEPPRPTTLVRSSRVTVQPVTYMYNESIFKLCSLVGSGGSGEGKGNKYDKLHNYILAPMDAGIY